MVPPFVIDIIYQQLDHTRKTTNLSVFPLSLCKKLHFSYV